MGGNRQQANPAVLGSIVTVYASGAGVSTAVPIDGTLIASSFGKPSLPVAMYSFPILSIVAVGQLLAGPLSLEVLYAGDAVGLVAGASQINFRLPGQINSGLNNTGFALQVGDAFSGTFTLYLRSQ